MIINCYSHRYFNIFLLRFTVMKFFSPKVVSSLGFKIRLFLAVFVLNFTVAEADDNHVFTDTIPIVERYGHILMPVTINHERKQLIFDTGAEGITLYGDKKPFKTKWISDGVDAKNHTKALEEGNMLVEFGSQCDSLIVSYAPLPSDSTLRAALLNIGDGLMGFCPLIRRGLNYFVKVDLRKGIMIVSNDHKWAKRTKGLRVSYKKCDGLPSFSIKVGKRHRTKSALDSGASHFCTIRTSVLDKWEKADKEFKACKVFDDSIEDNAGLFDTAIHKRRVKAYKCEFAIKSFKVDDAVIMDDPSGVTSVGEEIFHKAVLAFDPWHRKIIFQPYDK